MFIAGDIGGTKVRLAYYSEKNGLYCIHDEKYASHDFPDFASLLKQFLKTLSYPEVKSATFGIAGPIQGRTCKATNLPWIISADLLEKELRIPHVFLLNDLEANAWGLRCLRKEEFYTLNPGKEAQGNQALISAGTGLGEAGLYWDGKTHQPFACEGGHCDFSPSNEEEVELFFFLRKQFDHVSWERLLSGKGIYQIFRFLIETKKEESSLASLLEKEEQPQRLISQKGIKNECRACFRTCELFTQLYAREAANLALKFLARGGLFIGGGIAPNFAPFFAEEGRFLKAFLQKGRFASLLSEIPIHIALNDETALLGAAQYGKEKCQ